MNEHRWMGALAWRCLWYGLLAGLYSLAAVLGLVTVSFASWSFVFSLFWDDGSFRSSGNVGLLASLSLIGAPTLIGVVAGVVAAFHSSPQERGWSFLESIFLKGSAGLAIGLQAGIASGLIFGAMLGERYGWAVLLFLTFVGQIYGLGRGINLRRLERLNEERHA